MHDNNPDIVLLSPTEAQCERCEQHFYADEAGWFHIIHSCRTDSEVCMAAAVGYGPDLDRRWRIK